MYIVAKPWAAIAYLVLFEKRTGPTRDREGKWREEERKSSVQINAEWADMIIKKHFLLGRNSDGAQ